MSSSNLPIRHRGLSGPPLFPLPQIHTIRRRRADTIDSSRSFLSPLFDEEYKKYVHENLRPGPTLKSPWTLPAPQVPSFWTQKAISNAYFYGQYRLKIRNLTPRTETFLGQYRDVAKEAMQDPSREKICVLTALTKTLNSKVILLKEPSIEQIRGQQALKNLVFLRYLATYGDYLGEECKRFRDAAIEKKVEGRELFTGEKKTWTTVVDEIEREARREGIWFSKKNSTFENIESMPDSPTTDAIRKACNELGLDFENTKYSIHWYTQRNEKVHCMVDIFIKECEWDALGVRLLKDLKDLPNVVGTREQEQMGKVLENIKTRYFYRLDVSRCLPSQKADELRIKHNEKERRRIGRSAEELLLEQRKQTKLARTRREKDRSSRSVGCQFDGIEDAERRGCQATSCWEDESEDLGLDGLLG